MINNKTVSYVVFVATLLSIGLLAAAIFTQSQQDRVAEWNRHQLTVQSTPLAEYTRDRARRCFGFISNRAEQPIAGARVYVVDIATTKRSLMEDPTRLLADKLPIEQETITDSDGRFSFENLSIGPKALVSDAPGYGVATRAGIVIQDGIGVREDVQLHVETFLPIAIPEQWKSKVRVVALGSQWSVCPRKCVPYGSEFQLARGGAYDQGLIVLQEGTEPVAMATFHSSSQKITADDFVAIDQETTFSDQLRAQAHVFCLPLLPSNEVFDQVRLAANDSPTVAAFREFVSVVNPLCAAVSIPRTQPSPPSALETVGTIRGNTAGPFSPILISNDKAGFCDTVYSDGASEFSALAVPLGRYYVCAFSRKGHITYSKGCQVTPQQIASVSLSRLDVIDVEDENGRVLGYIDDGQGNNSPDTVSSEKMVVMQDATNFRKFLRQIPVDENGFFEFWDVPPRAFLLHFLH